MFLAGRNEIDPCGIDAAVSQHIRQTSHVLAGPVKGHREQMAQVMGKDLRGRHPRRLAQALHLRPDLPPRQTPAPSREKNLAGGDVLFLGILQQLPPEFPGDENGADFPFQADVRPPLPGRLHREILHLTHPDARSADALHEQCQPGFALGRCRLDQPLVFSLAQLTVCVSKDLSLNF